MTIWDVEIKEFDKLFDFLIGQLPVLGKEVEQLIQTQDANVVMLYSRRSLEVIITDLCESELKRPRKTEPLKGIIDKLNSEEKVPSHIIASMHSLNSMSTYGTHPKDFDPEQVKPVLLNLAIIIRWYLKYKDPQIVGLKKESVGKEDIKQKEPKKGIIPNSKKKLILLLSGAGLAVIIIIGGLSLFKVFGGREQIADLKSIEKSIAVLAFTDMSPGHDQEYLGDGIAQEILEKMSKFIDIKVIAMASSFSFKGKNEDIREIGKKLNVDNILTGSVRKEENQVRVTVDLIDAATGSIIFSEPYNYESKKILSLESDIAVDIAGKVNSRLSPNEKLQFENNKDIKPDAYEAYLRGRNALNSADLPSKFENAKKLFKVAVSLEPGFSEAYGYLSITYTTLANWAYPLKEKKVMLDSAALYAKNAITLNENNSIAHLAMGGIYEFKYDLINASDEINKAYKLNPGGSLERTRKALYLIFLDKADDEAVRLSKDAARLDPLNPGAILGYANVLLNAERYDECISTANHLLAVDTTVIVDTYEQIAWAYEGKKEYKKALQFWSKIHQRVGNQRLAELYLKSDFKTALEAYLVYFSNRPERKRWARDYVTAYVYAFIKDRENTLKYLDQAYSNNENFTDLKRWKGWDFIRNDPRFIELYEKTGFKAYDEYKKRQQ
jgi:adenylate cyclase